jgi:hypothetical protein
MSTSITDLIGSFAEAWSGKTELLDAVMTDDWDDIPLAPGQKPGRAVRSRMRGVHTGEFFGIAPTGRETEVRTHDFHEIVDGRIVRSHHMEDWVSWFQQVGSWPSS